MESKPTKSVSAIRAEFWIDCQKCGEEQVMVENHPKTGTVPTTKKEAYEAAIASGWSGRYKTPVCPECTVMKKGNV